MSNILNTFVNRLKEIHGNDIHILSIQQNENDGQIEIGFNSSLNTKLIATLDTSKRITVKFIVDKDHVCGMQVFDERSIDSCIDYTSELIANLKHPFLKKCECDGQTVYYHDTASKLLVSTDVNRAIVITDSLDIDKLPDTVKPVDFANFSGKVISTVKINVNVQPMKDFNGYIKGLSVKIDVPGTNGIEYEVLLPLKVKTMTEARDFIENEILKSTVISKQTESLLVTQLYRDLVGYLAHKNIFLDTLICTGGYIGDVKLSKISSISIKECGSYFLKLTVNKSNGTVVDIAHRHGDSLDDLYLRLCKINND